MVKEDYGNKLVQIGRRAQNHRLQMKLEQTLKYQLPQTLLFAGKQQWFVAIRKVKEKADR